MRVVYFTISEAMAVVSVLLFAAACVGFYALGCWLTNRKRDTNYLTYCDKKAQEKVADLTAQTRLDARVIEEKDEEIIDLKTRNIAAQHLAKQAQLALTPGIDIVAGVDGARRRA